MGGLKNSGKVFYPIPSPGTMPAQQDLFHLSCHREDVLRLVCLHVKRLEEFSARVVLDQRKRNDHGFRANLGQAKATHSLLVNTDDSEVQLPDANIFPQRTLRGK